MGNTICNPQDISPADAPKTVFEKLSSKMTQPSLATKDHWNRLQNFEDQSHFMIDMIGLIKIQTSEGKELCFTGFNVHPNYVISSADAVYNRKLNKFHNKIQFYPKVNGQLAKFQSHQIQDIVIHESFARADEPYPEKYNFSFIQLKGIVHITTFVKIIQVQHTAKACIYGYPKLEHQNILDDEKPHFYPTGGCGDILTLGSCSYEMTAESGLSGSPIYTYSKGEKDDDITIDVIGIHNGKGDQEGWSQGLLFTRQILDKLIEWEYDLTGKTDLQLISIYLRNQKASLIRSGRRITSNQSIKMSQCK